MSLLLEALKKAERAKEEAQRGARGEASEPRLETEAAPGAAAKHGLTRDELPHISQPRGAAGRKVVGAKFGEPNPRLPFFITVGVLGAFAIGTVIYFWLQLRPAPSLANANPPPPAGGRPGAG